MILLFYCVTRCFVTMIVTFMTYVTVVTSCHVTLSLLSFKIRDKKKKRKEIEKFK